MSRLPRFTSGASIERTGVPAASAFGQGLTELASRVQKDAEQNILRTGVAEATRAGELAGTQPNLQLPPGTTIAQREFNDAALRTNKQLISTDVMLKIPQLHQNALADHPGNTEAALNQFNKTSAQYENNLLQQTPIENRAFVQNLIKYHVGSTNLSLQNRLIREKQIASEGQFVVSDNASNNAVKDAVSAINFNQPKEDVQEQIDAAKRLLVHRFQGIDLAEEGGILNAEKASSLKSEATKEFQMNVIAKQYEFALKDNKGEQFINNLQTRSLQGFDEFDKANLIGKLKKIRSNVENFSQSSKLQQTQNAKDYLAALREGGKRNVQTESAYKSVFPQRAQFFDNQVKIASFVGNTVENMKEMSFEQQRQALEDAKPKSDEDNFPVKLKVFNDVQKQISQFNHSYNQDKVATLQDNPQVLGALVAKATQLDSGFNFQQLESSGFKPNTPNPHERMVIAQIVKGTPTAEVSVLNRNQAKNIVSQIESLANNPRAQIGEINRLRSEYGKTFPVMMRDLQKFGKLTFFPMYLASTSPNDPVIPELETALTTPQPELVKSLSESQQSDFKSIMTAESGDLEKLVGTYQSFNSFDAKDYINNLRSTERSLTLSYMVNKGLSASDARAKAVDYLTQAFNITSISGSDVRLPRTVDVNNVRVAAHAFQDKLLEKFNFNVPRGWLRKSYFDAKVQGGHWVTNNENTGLLWVDVDGNPVTDNKGNTFGFLFKDAANAFSSKQVINKEIQTAKDINKLNAQTEIFTTPLSELTPFSGGESP